MDFSLTDEQRAMRQTIRAFVTKEVLPLEQELLRRQRLDSGGVTRDEIRELQLMARAFGFWGPSTPVEYGGMGLSCVDQALLHMELGKTLVRFHLGGEADNILYDCDARQRERYLLPTIEGELVTCFAATEPDAGSDLTALRTTARRVGDDWVVEGEKTFITHGTDADLAIVIARTDPDADHRKAFTAFLIERGMGFTSTPIATMGQMRPAVLGFDGVRVPAANVLGEVGQGFELAMRWIGRGRYVQPSRAVGAAERLLGMAVEYAGLRRTFGVPIKEHQAIQWMIADSAADLEAARYLTLLAAWSAEHHGASRVATSAIAKLTAAVRANDIADRVLQIHGGMGYTQELPIQLWARDLRVLRIYEGSDEIQRRTLAGQVFSGRYRLGGHLS
ncbi:acyl-CoA dehydrogenase family protein [Streptomyces iranensis]|uniref:acyl-CoA dehydrogenase family protein n=1 Tax=Streptomyces iranensis TaxID=576784 RepID=UPI0039B766F9